MHLINEGFRTFRGYALHQPEESLTPSMEDYLEMAYRLSKEDGFTRVNDMAGALNVKPPSVTSMLQRMCEKKLIRYEKYGVIVLTPLGAGIARRLLKRHLMLESFFRLIGVAENLLENVERIEHNLTPEAVECLSVLVDFFTANPSRADELEKFRLKKLSTR